jgi:hypothetical protein
MLPIAEDGTAFMRAIAHGNLDIVVELWKHDKSDVNRQDCHGNTDEYGQAGMVMKIFVCKLLKQTDVFLSSNRLCYHRSHQTSNFLFIALTISHLAILLLYRTRYLSSCHLILPGRSYRHSYRHSYRLL